MSTNTVNPQPLLSYPEMAAIRTTPDGLVSWGGVAMKATRVYPKVPGMIFDSPGIGVYLAQGPSSQGMMDAWFTVAATGSSRDILSLISADGTTATTLGVDASNRPLIVVRDNVAAAAALFNASGGVIPSGTRVHYRFTWNSRAIVNAPLYVDLKVDDQAPAGAWVGGTAAWTPFVTGSIIVGGLPTIPFATNPFNGTLEAVQLGNQVA